MSNSSKIIAAKRTAVAVAMVCASFAAPAFAAGDVKGLLDLMLKKGVITQADYDQYMEASKDSMENQSFKEQRIDQDVSKSIKFIQKRDKDGSVKENGFGFKSADGNSEVNLTGRLHFDARSFDTNFGETLDRDSGSMANRFTARRARLGLTGILNKDISFELVTNLVGGNANLLDTGWVNYNFRPELQLRAGKMKMPLGMETLSSSNNIDFMERSYLDQVASPGKQFGLTLHGESGVVNYAFSGYQTGFDPLSNSQGLSPEAGARVNSDLAKAFNVGGDVVLHFGLAATTGKLQVVPTTSSQKGSAFETKGAVLAFRDEALGLTNAWRDRILGACPYSSAAGVGACTSSVTGYSLPAQEVATVNKTVTAFESAVAYGPAKFQYEFADVKINASSNAITAVSGTTYQSSTSGHAYVQYASFVYNLTGEVWKDAYKGGLFGGIKPKANFNVKEGTGGAFQASMRFSRYDASSFGASDSDGVTYTNSSSQKLHEVEGSPKGNTLTYGLNWILNPNARVMLNYSMTKFDNSFYPVDAGTVTSSTKTGNKSDALMLRTQFNF
jgi:phosphate-selective porin OprO/OprP